MNSSNTSSTSSLNCSKGRSGILIDFSDEVTVPFPSPLKLQAEVDDTFGIFKNSNNVISNNAPLIPVPSLCPVQTMTTPLNIQKMNLSFISPLNGYNIQMDINENNKENCPEGHPSTAAPTVSDFSLINHSILDQEKKLIEDLTNGLSISQESTHSDFLDISNLSTSFHSFALSNSKETTERSIEIKESEEDEVLQILLKNNCKNKLDDHEDLDVDIKKNNDTFDNEEVNELKEQKQLEQEDRHNQICEEKEKVTENETTTTNKMNYTPSPKSSNSKGIKKSPVKLEFKSPLKSVSTSSTRPTPTKNITETTQGHAIPKIKKSLLPSFPVKKSFLPMAPPSKQVAIKPNANIDLIENEPQNNYQAQQIPTMTNNFKKFVPTIASSPNHFKKQMTNNAVTPTKPSTRLSLQPSSSSNTIFTTPNKSSRASISSRFIPTPKYDKRAPMPITPTSNIQRSRLSFNQQTSNVPTAAVNGQSQRSRISLNPTNLQRIPTTPTAVNGQSQRSRISLNPTNLQRIPTTPTAVNGQSQRSRISLNPTNLQRIPTTPTAAGKGNLVAGQRSRMSLNPMKIPITPTKNQRSSISSLNPPTTPKMVTSSNYGQRSRLSMTPIGTTRTRLSNSFSNIARPSFNNSFK